MTKKKYRRYSPEFKRHALKRASEDGVTDKGVCEDLGISESRARSPRTVRYSTYGNIQNIRIHRNVLQSTKKTFCYRV